MKYSLSPHRTWPTLALLAALLSFSLSPLLARPDPPAADRLMDPSKPENQNAPHLFFHTDADTTPSPGAEAFKGFKGPATFAEFCKLHPLTGKPLGQDRLVLEVLATDVYENPAASGALASSEPTAAQLNSGNLIRQRLFANSQAQTENVLQIDRQNDGAKLSPSAWEGQRLFTSLEQTGAAYSLSFTFAESRVESWTKSSTSTQPVLAQREINESITLTADGKWAMYGGLSHNAPAANDPSVRKVSTILYLRLLKE